MPLSRRSLQQVSILGTAEAVADGLLSNLALFEEILEPLQQDVVVGAVAGSLEQLFPDLL